MTRCLLSSNGELTITRFMCSGYLCGEPARLCRDSLIFELLLNITTIRVHGVSPHFPRILGDHHAYQDIPSLLFD